MTHVFYFQIILLLGGIAIIVFLTTRLKVHPFFALFIVSLALGLGAGLPPADVLTVMKDGFGQIMKSLGFIIVLGTTLGVLLEQTGRTTVMANFILEKVGSRHATFAMSLTGFVVGMPIFCDSGFIVLSGLNQSLARRAGLTITSLAVCLATGLYSVHCLIPPHPGAAAAAGIIGVDFGRLLLTGVVVALPAMLVGYWWAVYAGKGSQIDHPDSNRDVTPHHKGPSVALSFAPVFVPLVLIALKSFLVTPDANTVPLKLLSFFGDPSLALFIGILLCFVQRETNDRAKVSLWLHEAVEKSGSILVIIGAGGAFGHVLAAMKIGEHFSEVLPLQHLGILFPFLLTFLLKTAQGSSTVAIITAASIVEPLLPALGLDTETGRLLSVLAMGGGSMMISHANDAYFWVISKFEAIPMNAMLRVYSIATLWMGLTTLTVVYIMSLVL
ncbi:GntP family permease [Chryseolinea lacunae]|uniref:GntP family permease n=1 Tax=Chryseolinea lacunae TaxID=2801331 RepID=A0ABS1L162_9BACT|nr:GntP family permease [Chryseolinea lacunae]MBL0745434.1 GntP family permease [Chryseolinea lacunae]